MRQHVLGCLSRSIGVYRPPAVHFDGISDGISAVPRAERQTEQMIERLGDNRVGMKGAAPMVRHNGEKLSKWNPGRNDQYPVRGLAIEQRLT